MIYFSHKTESEPIERHNDGEEQENARQISFLQIDEGQIPLTRSEGNDRRELFTIYQFKEPRKYLLYNSRYMTEN